MLTAIVQICNFIQQSFYFGLVISYKTGQLIIYGVSTLIALLIQINKHVAAVVQVLLEDFYVFLHDVSQRLLHIVNIVYGVLQSIINGITIVCETFKFVVLTIVFIATETYHGIFGAISKVFAGLGHMFVTIKYLIILLGSGIWFTVTIIPLFIAYTCTITAYYVLCLVDEAVSITTSGLTSCRQFLNTLFEFLTDVPFESAAGLIAGSCILYVIIKFQILLYRIILSTVELMKQRMHRIRLRLSRFVYRQPVIPIQHSSSESEETASSDESVEDVESSESRLCLICQDRAKCILMLPCRHICVCNVCNARLQNYNRTCPICRAFVQKTMKVFV